MTCFLWSFSAAPRGGAQPQCLAGHHQPEKCQDGRTLRHPTGAAGPAGALQRRQRERHGNTRSTYDLLFLNNALQAV